MQKWTLWIVVACAVAGGAALTAVRSCGARTDGSTGAEPARDAASPAVSVPLPQSASPPPTAPLPDGASQSASGTTKRAPTPRAAPPQRSPAVEAADTEPKSPQPTATAPPTKAPAAPVARDARESLPSDAVAVDAASGTRAWLASDRAPRGLVSEAGAIPGRVQVHLSQPAKTALAFRVESDPPESLKILGREPIVRIPAGRDVGSVGIAGVRSGAATIVARLVEGGDAVAAPVLRTSVEVRSQDEFPDPVVVVTTEAPQGDDASGSLVSGERRMAGLRGAVCGTLRIRRSGFRGFATTPTDADIVVDDPAGILEPLPRTVTIAAGASEPSDRISVRLRDAEGRATIRVRAAGAETPIAVESVTARWQGPESVVVPAGAIGRVRLRCAPGSDDPPRWTASAGDSSVLAAEAAPASQAPTEEGVVLSVRARAAGETTVRVAAPHRPGFDVRVVVVAAEAALRDGRPVLLGLPAGAKGTIVVSVAAPGRFEDVADAPRPRGARVEISKDRTVTFTIDEPLAAAGDVTLPVRLTGGAPGARVRVADRVRAPARAEYEIDAQP